MAKEYIKYNHLKRLLTCQPFFVWNNLPNNEINLEDIEDDKEFWEIDFSDDIPLKFAEVIKNGYAKVNLFFKNQIIESAKKQNKNILFINEKNNELAFNKTMQAINNKEIDWIINPVFIYEDLLIKPSLYKKDVHELSSLINSSKTKLINYIQAYFEVNVMKLLKLTVNDYSFFTYDNKFQYKDSPDLKFKESNYCWTQKNSPSSDMKTPIDKYVKKTIIEKINTNIVIQNRTSSKSVGFVYSFDDYINRIRLAKNETKFVEINKDDLTNWGENPFFLDIFPFEKIKSQRVSGNLLQKKDLLDILKKEVNENDLIKNKLSLKLVNKKENMFNFDVILDMIKQIENLNCIWYDFEGFSMPYVIFKNTKPYQQLVFQVSVIKTIDDKIVGKSNNLVIDPQTINVNDFKEIVDAIYDENANKYIVYNRNYEHKKLREIKNIFKYELEKSEYDNYCQKMDHIINNTFDLLELFAITKAKEKIPPIFLYELKGYSSIKKIENYITQNNIILPTMITPYKNLEVQNGLMAMNKAIQRYLGTIGDIEWENVKQELAKYCENDVKAMIMVYHFVKLILEKNYFNPKAE